MPEQPFDYLEAYQPPPGQGYTRYAGATLVRTEDRRHWRSIERYEHIRWVMDDFGFLTSFFCSSEHGEG
jgi:hypothetical protein